MAQRALAVRRKVRIMAVVGRGANAPERSGREAAPQPLLAIVGKPEISANAPYSHFERTEQFCGLFDQVVFNLNFKSMPLQAFEPMLRRAFCEPHRSIYLAEGAE
jgi:hypothetical protein